MIDYQAENAIESIPRKLCGQKPLTENEIHMVMTALRRQHNYTQEPFYEVVYHDEYDRQERRIMNPISHSCKSMIDSDYMIISDGFEIHFNRFVQRKRGSEKLERIEQIIKDYDGSTPSMIKQFSELQRILEQDN